MSAVQLLTEHLALWSSADTEKKSGRGRASGNAASVYGVKKLRELILELAVRGKLVPQDASDEPASELLKRIEVEKAKQIADGKIKKNKPLAAISNDEKPFELPKGWEWEKLGFIGYTQTGGTPKKSNSESFGSDIPFIKPSDIYPNQVDYFNEGLSLDGAEELGRIASANSLLMVCIGTIGKCNLIDRNCSFNQQINSVTPYEFNSKYLLIVCRSIYFYSEAWSRSFSTTIPILNKGNWEQICVPIPSIAEQHRIVAKVDELMALCDQLENQHTDAIAAHEKLVSYLLDTLTQSKDASDFNESWQRIAANFEMLFTTESSIDALKQTLLQLAVMGKLVSQDASDEPASELLKRIQAEKAKLVAEGKIKKSKPLAEIGDEEKPFELSKGWEWCKGEDVADFIDPQPSHRTPPVYDGGVPYVGYTDIDLIKGINLASARKVNPEVLKEHQKRYQLKVGDFVFGKIGTLGKPFFLTQPFEYCLSANLILIQPKLNAISPKYLALYLDSPQFLFILGNEKTNSTHGVFGIQKARLLQIPFPPFLEQHRIVAKVDELMTLCDTLKSRITVANQLQQKIADVMVEQAVA